MQKIIFYSLLLLPAAVFGQVGLKAGVNFANVSNASSINADRRSGFMIGAFFAPSTGGVMGYRSEIIYSKQGYDYATNTNTGTVDLNYIVLPQLTTINITKFVQLQLGVQMAYLLNAKVDSSRGNNSTGGYGGGLMDLYNRFDYGFGGGIEIHPFKGLLIGARYNIGLGNLYKDPSSYSQSGRPSFIPKVDAKNNVVQIFAGWIFGKQSGASKKNKQ